MICPRCGAENESKINFCKACGNPIASNIVEPIDFGKTQAVPVVVKPIEPMSKEEEEEKTSVIPVVSEEVVVEKLTPDEEEQRRKAMRDELMYTSEMEQVKVNIKQLESVKKPRKKRPVLLIIVLVVLFLSSALGITYYLCQKDVLCFANKKETTTTVETTTTAMVNVDTEIRNSSKEVILNSNSHTLKYSYEITKDNTSYKPVLKIFLDNTMIGEPIIQDNSYNLMTLYDTILKTEIYTIEDQVINGTDKDYYYINVFINNKYYVYIINETQVIYSNITGLFSTEDIESIYNNKSSLIKEGKYSYIKEYDTENGIEQIASIANDEITFEDGEIIKGFWK